MLHSSARLLPWNQRENFRPETSFYQARRSRKRRRAAFGSIRKAQKTCSEAIGAENLSWLSRLGNRRSQACDSVQIRLKVGTGSSGEAPAALLLEIRSAKGAAAGHQSWRNPKVSRRRSSVLRAAARSFTVCGSATCNSNHASSTYSTGARNDSYQDINPKATRPLPSEPEKILQCCTQAPDPGELLHDLRILLGLRERCQLLFDVTPIERLVMTHCDAFRIADVDPARSEELHHH